MFGFVLQKLRSKKWMIISLLIGNILLTSIIGAARIYTDAVLQRTINSNFSNYITENNKHPGNVIIEAEIEKDEPIPDEYSLFFDSSSNELETQLGLPVLDRITEKFLVGVPLIIDDEDEQGEVQSTQVKVGYLSGIEENIDIVHGEMYGSELEADGSIGVIISETTLINKNLFIGERYDFKRLADTENNILSITIKGVFDSSEGSDSYWTTPPANYRDNIFMDEELFENMFIKVEEPANTYTISEVIQLDYTAVKTNDVERLLSVSENYLHIAENVRMDFTANYFDILTTHIDETNRLNVTVLVLQLPICVLLAVFIFMVSRQMIENELTEIAVFKSRGASKRQILSIYLMQSVLISFAGLVIGTPLSYLICQVLGSSNAFLEFVNRAALPISFNVQALVFSLIAVVFSIITMVIPAVKHADVGIVMAKQKKQQRFKLKWWEKIGLDVILIAVSLYGWYSFNAQREILAQRMREGASLDPLMFFSSSIFIIGVALLAMRVFTPLMKLIFFIGRKKWSPSVYLSLKRVINTDDNRGFIMMFLIMTISLGLFNSICARTINSNEENRIIYENGADIVIKEVWNSNEAALAYSSESFAEEDIFYTEPDYAKFSDIEGIESHTKVLVMEDVEVSGVKGDFENTILMGIHTKEFGETATFSDGLLDFHWYEYLNAISQNPQAILMSQNAADEFGFEVGDAIYYRDSEGENRARGIIYAFIDYWPTYNSTEISIGDDGTTQESNQYLIVGHLSYSQSVFTNTPYEVWINMQDDSLPVYDFVQENELELVTFTDTSADITAQKNQPIFQGTNGLFTVGFIMILLQCAVGFLIFWILSIIRRQLQFGIYRAMGMSMREIVTMLVCEQIFISGYSVAIGTAIGFVVSSLFVPLIEISYAPAEQPIPLELIISAADNLRIFAVIGIMILLCLIVLSNMISRLKIAQALKLGED